MTSRDALAREESCALTTILNGFMDEYKDDVLDLSEAVKKEVKKGY